MTPRSRATRIIAVSLAAAVFPAQAASAAPLRSWHAPGPWLDVAYVVALILALVLATYFALKARSSHGSVITAQRYMAMSFSIASAGGRNRSSGKSASGSSVRFICSPRFGDRCGLW